MSIAGKICVVTGANQGVGLETARGLVSRGGTVILGCRNESRGKTAVKDIMGTTKAPEERVHLMILDTSSQASIRNFAKNFSEQYDRLDILVNNAGIGGANKKETTVDGLEKVFGTNVMGYFLLSNLLLPQLNKTGNARIVNVASSYVGQFDINDLNFDKRTYSANAAYQQSKQANRMLSWVLNEKLREQGSKIILNTMTPGMCNTKLLSDLGFGGGKSPADGAAIALYLATHKDVEGITGKFWNGVGSQGRLQFTDKAKNEALWSICESFIKK
mmetsp:Transcript_25347/g.28195  ORF Transcript_25347/g.28195 Transcript_25347/m.28195 type:complete len:274 (+) Transcript_25347:55-876(+)